MDLSAVDEVWFLERMDDEEADVSEIVEVFEELAAAERGEEATGWAQMLFQKFAEADQYDRALIVLEWLAAVRGVVEEPRGAVEKLFSKDRNALKLVEPAGFGDKLPLSECFRRLRYLRTLKAGMLCYNETWGFGIIEEIDFFYQQLEIDFERKGEHEMSFAYAAEALEPLDDSHILALKHNNPDELERMIKESPADVVRITLRSYGNMPVTRLQEKLVPSIVPKSGWKKFWEGARIGLKDDAHVIIPKKRSENIVWHKRARCFDDEWFGKLVEMCDIDELFEQFKELVDKKIETSSDAARASLSNRLAFIIRGAPSSRPEWKAEGIVYSHVFGIKPESLDTTNLIRELLAGDLVAILENLQTRQLQGFLAMLLEYDRETAISTLCEVIPVISHPVLNEVMALLVDGGAEEAVREIMAAAVARRTAGAPMLLWIQRSAELVSSWNLISKCDLAFRILEVLEVDGTGTMLRAQNQLRELFQQQGWLNKVMRVMSEQQRRDFVRRINEGAGWDLLDRKSILAKIIRRFPELQEIILPTASAAPKKDIPYTSNRSYTDKQRQLERIVKVEIPENSKEIETARSYGDLRENAEFKYAKERQGLLMAQAGQLAEDLERIKPTDFSTMSSEGVAPGCGVELAYPGGKSEIYYILGIWDQDESLSIISSETRLSKALFGHKPGDRVEIPAGECELKAILPLSEAVRQWITG